MCILLVGIHLEVSVISMPLLTTIQVMHAQRLGESASHLFVY
jgi:hypothetical protein